MVICVKDFFFGWVESSLQHVGSLLQPEGFSSCGMWVYLPLGMWHLSSLTKDPTQVPCIGRQILYHWTTRQVLKHSFYHWFFYSPIHSYARQDAITLNTSEIFAVQPKTKATQMPGISQFLGKTSWSLLSIVETSFGVYSTKGWILARAVPFIFLNFSFLLLNKGRNMHARNPWKGYNEILKLDAQHMSNPSLLSLFSSSLCLNNVKQKTCSFRAANWIRKVISIFNITPNFRY